MNAMKMTATRRWVLGLILMLVFVGFSNRIIAHPSSVKKTVYEQATGEDPGEDDCDDDHCDLIFHSLVSIALPSGETKAHKANPIQLSGQLGTWLPKWILNRQLKLGSTI